MNTFASASLAALLVLSSSAFAQQLPSNYTEIDVLASEPVSRVVPLAKPVRNNSVAMIGTGLSKFSATPIVVNTTSVAVVTTVTETPAVAIANVPVPLPKPIQVSVKIQERSDAMQQEVVAKYAPKAGKIEVICEGKASRGFFDGLLNTVRQGCKEGQVTYIDASEANELKLIGRRK